MSIPRIIHQIWLGPKPIPLAYTQTWDHFAARTRFVHLLWSESTIETIDFPTKELYHRALAANDWHAASDIARMGILWSNGGYYFDCDMVWSWLTGPYFPELSGFCATTEHQFPPQHIATSVRYPADDRGVESAFFLCNGFLAAEQHHPVLRLYHEKLGEHVSLNGGRMTPETVGCYFLTWCAKRHPFTLIPMDWIFPCRLHQGCVCRYIERYEFQNEIGEGNQAGVERAWTAARAFQDKQNSVESWMRDQNSTGETKP